MQAIIGLRAGLQGIITFVVGIPALNTVAVKAEW